MRLRAADLSGVDLPQLYPHELDLIISEMYNCATLARVVNSDFDIQSLGLDCNSVATYTTLSDISMGDFTEGDLNGEVWEPSSPFGSGEIALCQHIPFEKKFSRSEVASLCKRWEVVKDGYEKAIANALRLRLERYGFLSLASYAGRHMTGSAAGIESHDIDLGTPQNPLIVSDKATGDVLRPSDVIERLEMVHGQVATDCASSGLKIVAPQKFYAKLRREQGNISLNSCCPDSNPLISGFAHPTFGMETYESKLLPKSGDVQYVFMINPMLTAAPAELKYFEWQTIKHDIYLVGDFWFDVVAMTPNSVAVAAIKVEQ